MTVRVIPGSTASPDVSAAGGRLRATHPHTGSRYKAGSCLWHCSGTIGTARNDPPWLAKRNGDCRNPPHSQPAARAATALPAA
jgi:hypothetical protein